MSRFSEFFLTQSTPRWQIMLGGLALIAVGWAQNNYFYERALIDDQIVAQQQRIESKVVEIQQNSIDFQTFANSYVTAVMDGSTDAISRRDLLIDNILKQDAAVDVSRVSLDLLQSPEVDNYRSALRKMKLATEQVTDIPSMGAFWASASDLLVSRNALLKSLQQTSRNVGI